MTVSIISGREVFLSRQLPEDVRLVFTGDSEHRAMIQQGLQNIDSKRVINLAGTLTLSEFSELTSHAPVVLTGDSFPLHVAEANHRPIVALFGPTDESKVGPLGAATVVLRSKNVDCVRCYRRTSCPKACISHISPEQVYEALQTVTREPI